MAGESLLMFPSGFKAGKLYSQIPISGVGDFDVSRPNDVATRINKLGLIETMLANVPRLDYTDGVCPVLLVEPQSTNLQVRSEEFDNGVYTKTNLTITANSIIAPDGTLTADTAAATSNNGLLQDVFTGTSGVTYTVSVWLKRKTGTGQVNIRSVENFSTPITITNEWVRYSVSTLSTSTVIRTGIALDISSDEVYIWGIQAELGSLSSYIKTENTSVTRLADVLTVAPPVGTVSIIETIDNVDQTPIIIIPGTFTVSEGNINKITMT